MRLDPRLHRLVRVADPGDVGCDVERRAEWTAAFVGYRHAELACDQLRAKIVRMAAERSSARPAPLEKRTKIGHEPIVPGHQLVELTASADVLILERLRLARLRGPEHRLHDFVIDCREVRTIAWEEPRDH